MAISGTGRKRARRLAGLFGPDVVGFPKVLMITAGADRSGTGTNQSELIRSKLAFDGWPVARLNMSSGGKGSLRAIRRVIRAIPQADIVHLFVSSWAGFIRVAAPVIALSRFFGRRIIVSVYGSSVLGRIDRGTRMGLKFLRQADRVVVPSKEFQRLLKATGVRVDQSFAMVDFDAVESRILQRLQPRILMTCSSESYSDAPTVVRAFSVVKQKYPRTELVIAGEGKLRRVLERMVAEKSIFGVEFVGKDKDPGQLARETDLCVHASVEGEIPLTLQAAMASGLPIVAAAGGAVREILTDGYSGLLFEPGNESDLADRILKLVEDDLLVGELSQRGRAEAEKFAWDNLKSTWTSLYLATARQ